MTSIPRTALQIAYLSTAAEPSVAILQSVNMDHGSDGAPEWIHLLQQGVNSTVDGRGPFTVDAAVVARNSLEAGDRLAIDENHSIDVAAPKGEPSPARGWIVDLEARTDGLWGKVEWNAGGRALLADKAYRNISPVIAYRPDGAVVSVLRASLTNRPNLRGLTALNAMEPDDMSLIANLRTALNLAETADETACLAAVKERAGAAEEAIATLGEIRSALKLPDETTAEALLAAVKSQGGNEQIATLQAQIIGQQKALNAIEAQSKKTAAEHCIDEAIKAGKVGVKPLRDHYVARHMADAAAVEKEIAAMPTLSGRLIDDKGGSVARLSADATPQEIAAAADRHIAEQKERGVTLNFAQAVRAVTAL